MPEIPPETKEFAFQQFRQALGQQPSVTCECGSTLPLRFMYKCLYCKMYLCEKCAEVHFGKTVQEYLDE